MNREQLESNWVWEQMKDFGVTVMADDAILVSENMKRFEESKKRGELIVPVIMGPSGSGKDTLINMMDDERFARVKTVTTRPRERYESEENDEYVRKSFEEFKIL